MSLSNSPVIPQQQFRACNEAIQQIFEDSKGQAEINKVVLAAFSEIGCPFTLPKDIKEPTTLAEKQIRSVAVALGTKMA